MHVRSSDAHVEDRQTPVLAHEQPGAVVVIDAQAALEHEALDVTRPMVEARDDDLPGP